MKTMPATIKLKRPLNIFILSLALMLIQACGGKKQGSPTPALTKATLSFPAQNSLCNSGSVISDTQAALVLTWSAAANADSYDVIVKNLLTGTSTTQSSATNQLSVTLLRNTPYSWYVVSKSTRYSGTSQSDTWKFYMSGPGSISYSPFPATLVSPAFAKTVTGATKINLVWTGNDVDNDLANYDVYFGTAPSPPLLRSNITDLFLNNVAISAGTTYYWRVLTRDTKGNVSYSDIYQFKVN